MEQRTLAAVQPGEMVRHQPGFGNRNLLFGWGKRALKEGKITRSNGKYYRAFPENKTLN
jgi:hypothetical protein